MRTHSLMVASRGTLPAWLPSLSLVIGVLAIAAAAYIPSFAIPIWGLVMGGWLIAPGWDSRSTVRAAQSSA